MISHTLAAVLAGGSSTRMGENKSELILGGQTFMERIHATLQQVFAEVVICGGDVVPEGGVLIEDEEPGIGPLAGMLAGLRAGQGRAVLFVAVDIPLVAASLIRSIAEPEVASDSARIVSVDERDQPLLGVYGTDIEAIVRGRVNEQAYSVVGMLDGIAAVERVQASRSDVLNVNTPRDYVAIVERLASPGAPLGAES